ncbi:MAG: hypothetical protein J2P31_14570 [Blastocatellia bacterium]|nr:hypothetical protein [Blastocatellia bacterium]
MAIDPKKRQKKLAKDRAKRKAKAVANRRAQHRRSPSNQRAALGLELAARSPIHECYVNENIMTPGSSPGMGTVIVSRKTSAGIIAAGVYLLDVFCLGVKDAFARPMTREEYRDTISGISRQESMKKVEPAVAKKLVENAVAYARNLGFEPHPDFRLAQKLLEDIDASSCTMEFTFGDRGKPHFISGPYDSQARIAQIKETLERTCGKGNYIITILLGDPFSSFFGDDNDDDDYEEEEDYDEDEDYEGEDDEDEGKENDRMR